MTAGFAFARLRVPLALALASAAHVAAFAMVPHRIGTSGGAGEDGTALISLQAASDQIAALVQEWDRPPVLADLTVPDVPLPAPTPDLPQLTPADAPPLLAVAPPKVPPPLADLPPEAAVAPSPAPNVEIGAVAGLALTFPKQEETAVHAPAAAPDTVPQAPTVAPPTVSSATADVAPPSATPPAPATSDRPEPRPKAAAQPKTARTEPTPHPTKAAPKPRATEAPSAGQKASGAGQGTVAGQGERAKGTTLSKARINDLKSGWGSEIRARIEARKRYPAQANGASGKVTLRLTITRDGRLSAVSVAKSSGSAVLDAAAVRAVKATGRFSHAPKGLSEASYSFTLPMSFAR